MMGRMLRGLFLGGTAAVLIVAAFVLGMTSAFVLRPSAPLQVPEDVAAPANFKIYGEVWRYIDREYYGGRPAAEQITRGALEGLVASLEDPWALLAPQEVSDAEWFAPHYVDSLGAWIEPVAQGARVLAVVPGGGADEGGLEAGDLIVDAQPTDDAQAAEADQEQSDPDAMDSADAAALFAPSEAEAPLINDLEGADGPLTVVLLRTGRAALQMEVVPDVNAGGPPEATVEVLEDGAVLVRPQRVDEAGVDALAEALAALADTDDAKTALVLDLRDNPGGDLETLAQMAGLFSDGPLWLEKARDREARTIEGEQPARGASVFDADARLVVLVNRGTVGAAEMLAAALQERVGAVLLGEASFGRATRTEVRPLADGTLLRLSVSRWETAGGLSVAEGGLEPTRVISGRDAQREAALAVAAGEPLPPAEPETEEASAGAGGG